MAADAGVVKALPSEEISPERQRTIWGETTKDKAGALPPAVYTKQQDFNKVDLMVELENDFNTKDPVVSTREEREDCVHATFEGGDVTEVTFVDDCQVAVAVAKAQPPPDECETDLEDDFPDREGEDFAPITV